MRAVLLRSSCAVALCLFSAAHAEGDSPAMETITVTAPGEIRHIQTVTDTALAAEGPGVSPLQAVALLPSVDYLASDAYGTDEFGVRISIRGFNQNQLGFTLDGVPLGDMSYGNWNGLHISRAIINENIARTSLSQGTGALDTASNSNLGGTLQFFSVTPSDQPMARVEQSFGSDNFYRTFLRLDSGALPSGTKLSISGVYEDVDKWKGGGNISQPLYQINGKLVQNVGGEGRLTAFVNYSDHRESENESVSHDMIGKLGYNWDYVGNWGLSVSAADAIVTEALTGVKNYPVSAVNALSGSVINRGSAIFYGGSGLRKDTLGGVTYETPLTEQITLKTTAYGHRDDGVGLWFAPSVDFTNPANGLPIFSVNGSPILMRSSEYGLTRYGDLSSVTGTFGDHEVAAGFWLEQEVFTLARRLYATSPTGPDYDLLSFPTNPWLTQWAYHFDTTVAQAYLQDHYRISDDLAAVVGAKLSDTWTDGRLAEWAGSPSNFAQGDLFAGNRILPQFGLTEKLFGSDELFADIAKNMRAFVAGGPGFTTSPWGTTQANWDSYIKGVIKPETSWTEEIGYRFAHGPVTAELSAFHTNFSNRLIAAQPAGVATASGVGNILTNVGGVTSNGVDLAATVKLPADFTWYNGVTWNRSTYDKDVLYSGVWYQTEGKITYDTPKYLYKTDLSWHDSDGFFAHFEGQYTSRRYYSHTDDAWAGSFFIANVGAGYGLDRLGPLQDTRLQLNIHNLFDKKYVASFTGAEMSDAQGIASDLLVGAPRTISGTLSARW